MALHSSLNVLSLCTGGGGLDLGFKLAIPSARTVCMVEREAFAVARLVDAMQAGLMAPAPVWSDARTFDGRPWRGVVDCLIGGYPCQGESRAGKRLGIADPRWLWPAFRRIIVQARPRCLFLENVGNHLTKSFGLVYRDLARLGFKVEAGLFTAAESGASHTRERLFILAVADAEHGGRTWWLPERGGAGATLPRNGTVAHAEGRARRPGYGPAGQWAPAIVVDDGDGAVGNPDGAGSSLRLGQRSNPSEGRASAERASGFNLVADAAGCDGLLHARPGRPGEPPADPGRSSEVLPLFPPGPGDLGTWSRISASAPHLEPAVCGMAHGLADRMDSLRLLGNGVVPLAAAYALRTLAARLAPHSLGAARLVRLMEACA